MPYLLAGDFDTHLYSEVRNEVVRDNNDIIDKAIISAVTEAKSYLSRFDLLKLFGNDDTPPTVEDENLKGKVKDIACWRMIKLANPNISMELFKTLYDDAIKWLKDVQSGKADPEGWPYKKDEAETDYNENDNIQWSSNIKRNNHF